MPTLDIHLQEGFAGDEVIVRIDGEERLRRAAVHTRRALSLAEHVTFEVDAGAHVIDVSVRGIERRIAVDVADKLYVGIGVKDDELRVRVRDKQFGYG
ncbi:MAG TPA: hypothetical protein VN181_08840 [Thermoanaerobaculia bacterium]|nr:hypothetical protein [Thermoanaerobaculia bacterium]